MQKLMTVLPEITRSENYFLSPGNRNRQDVITTCVDLPAGIRPPPAPNRAYATAIPTNTLHS